VHDRNRHMIVVESKASRSQPSMRQRAVCTAGFGCAVAVGTGNVGVWLSHAAGPSAGVRSGETAAISYASAFLGRENL
jgi:hypothetical protein